MKAAILLAVALFTLWAIGPTWQEDGGGPTTQGGCHIDPDGKPVCQP